MVIVPAYPLTWPAGFPRSSSLVAGDAFRTTLPAALNNVEHSLELFAKDSKLDFDHLVISSNVTLGAQRPLDPGVAVWFNWDGQQRCIAVDRYAKVEANLQAIHHVIEARRTELRHGGLHIVRATFTGFKALPRPAGTEEWWDVLQCKRDASIDVVEQQFRRLAKDRHPDKGGTHEKMVALNRAIEVARKARREGF